ncbi:c-type cytochrome [Vibrio superstes]|uniref:Cytochrome c n=1 Tax=Vibrio superstes NBRC 103154 TaxID=1219062 RepID=A0A511QKF9_9VIBR|nr:c-type cytochrome [Vibrio superstes]GEM77779.1 cytochrome c [Vibrio superstes NBRC 103154]
MKRLIKTLTLSIVSTYAFADSELPDKQAEIPAVSKSSSVEYLKPRSLDTIPDTEFGEKVELGYSLFVNSQQMRGKYVGNEQNCVNCHMQAGMKANAAPLWGAFMAYPAYRSKNDKVNSYAERIQGCFTYSMNGKAPNENSEELVAIAAYSYWLAMGGILDQHGMGDQPVPELSDQEILQGGKREGFKLPDSIVDLYPVDERSKLAGRGYPKLADPEQKPDLTRGKLVYTENCAVCHGENGEGIKGSDGRSYLPPLWGAGSYNWGAGMHRVNTAAYFIYENMPLGKSIQLTEQQAWDVAAFVNSHERPQDPRFKGDVKANAGKYHNHDGFYGKSVNGKTMGDHAYPSGEQVIK